MIICLKQVHISIVGKEFNHLKGALEDSDVQLRASKLEHFDQCHC